MHIIEAEVRDWRWRMTTIKLSVIFLLRVTQFLSL